MLKYCSSERKKKKKLAKLLKEWFGEKHFQKTYYILLHIKTNYILIIHIRYTLLIFLPILNICFSNLFAYVM